MIRLARESDRANMRALDELIFEEDPAFAAWLFAERFLPEYSVVAELDGRIAGMALGLNCHARMRGGVLPACILSSVCTHKDFRGRGLMGEMLRLFMENARARGIAVVPHRPVVLSTYFKHGHFPVADMRYVRRTPAFAGAAHEDCRLVGLFDRAAGLCACYGRAFADYSVCVSRSYADMFLKLRDYAASGSEVMICERDRAIRGYLVSMPEEGGWLVDEFAADDPAIYQRLLESYCASRPLEHITFRAAPDVAFAPDGLQIETLPRAVMGAANVSMLLRVSGLEGGCIRVSDPVVAANNGLFALDGSAAAGEPGLEISAGALAQWAAGYLSVAEIEGEGRALVSDRALREKMDGIGKRPCFLVDEY